MCVDGPDRVDEPCLSKTLYFLKCKCDLMFFFLSTDL